MIADDKEDMHFIRLDCSLDHYDQEGSKFSFRIQFIPGGFYPSDNPAVFEIGNMDEELKVSLDLPRDLQIELIDVLREDILCWRESLAPSSMPDELSANSQDEKLNTEARDD